MQRAHRFIELNLHHGGRARRNALAAPDGDTRGDIGSGQVQMHRRPVFERLRFARQHTDTTGDALRRMIGDIGRFRNWQFAFFESFQRRFKQPADVEKWWAVQVAAVTGRNPVQLLTPAQSLSRLEEVLSVPVVIQQTSNSLPRAAHVTLRQVVTDWDFNRENPALRRMHDDLAGLRYRAAPELIRLIESGGHEASA